MRRPHTEIVDRPIAAAAAAATTAALLTACIPASWGANALLHPTRHAGAARSAPGLQEVTFAGEGVTLEGWRIAATGARHGTIVYLHGIADNRMSGAGVAERFAARGFDVIAYDSRAHGNSGGDACTYGYYEKRDLMRVLDRIDSRPIVLFGVSLGAAVALQTAAIDSRPAAVVAVEVFSDLETVVRDRAPWFVSERDVRDSLSLAEKQAAFRVSDVSPVKAAARIRIPVLLIHGAEDHDTPPEHSKRVFEALAGPKRLILVPHAGHNHSLNGPVWREIDDWLDAALRSSREPVR